MLISDTKNIKLSVYIKYLKEDKIDLEPEYQRNFIWSPRIMIEYITSLLNGTAPTMFVINSIKKYKRIIDGKQRSTSIKKFINNEFPININNVPHYYSKTGEDGGRVFKKDIVEQFGNIDIPVVEYKNLSFGEETKIFTLLQSGVSLRQGEKVLGYITNVKKSLEFNKIAESLSEDFKSYCNTIRREHHLIVLQYLHFYHNNILSIKLDDCKKSLEELDKSNELSEVLQKVKIDLKWIAGIINDPLLNKIKDLKKKKVFYTVLYGLKVYKSLLDIDTIEQKDICERIKRFVGTISIDLSDKFSDVTKELFDEFQSNIEKFIKKHKPNKKKSKTIKDKTDKIELDSESSSENGSENESKNGSENEFENGSDSDIEPEKEQYEESENEESENGDESEEEVFNV